MNVPEKLVSHGDTMLNEMNFDEADERLDRANEIKAKIALIKAQHNL